jgi:arabinogalactan oligomer / maltooligosaccharide transport system permease protein
MAVSEPVVRPAAEPVAVRVIGMPPRRWLRELGWRYLVAGAAIIFALFPIAWIISASVNPIDNLISARLVPRGVTLDSYQQLFQNPLAPFGRWLSNTLKIAFIGAILIVTFSALASYSFSRLRWKGRRTGLLTLLLVQIFPNWLAFVAIYLLLIQIGGILPALGLGTHAGLILVYLGGALGVNTWLLKGFMDSIPYSLDEAAVVDGASNWQVFTRVILPLARPVLAVIFLLTFISLYGEYILAAVILRDADQYTMAVGLQLFVQSEYTAKWGQLAAAAVIGAFPITLVWLFMQDQIVSGLTQGAVKG